MASLYSIQGMGKEGLEWLEKAFEKGFDNFEYLVTDPNMLNVRGMEGFTELLNKYKKE